MTPALNQARQGRLHTPDFLWHSAPPWYRSAYGQQAGMVLQSARNAGFNFAISSVFAPGGELANADFYESPNLWGRELAENAREAFAGTSAQPKALAFTNLELIADDLCEGIDLALWVPFNFSPPPPKLLEYLQARRSTQVLALTRWAQEAFRASGFASTYIPHGVDLEVFYPDPASRSQTRAMLGLSAADFVVGVVAANNEWFGNRKSFPELIAAFAIFSNANPNAVLYLHTDMSGEMLGGLDLNALCHSIGIPEDRLLSTSFDRYEVGLSRFEVADLYRSFDVLLSPSAGEGFGIPVVEAQACGVRPIVSNWAAQQELAGAGWRVGGQIRWANWVRSWQITPSIPEIVLALEAAFENREYPHSAAVRFGSTYDHDEVFQRYWLPFLERWTGRVDG